MGTRVTLNVALENGEKLEYELTNFERSSPGNVYIIRDLAKTSARLLAALDIKAEYLANSILNEEKKLAGVSERTERQLSANQINVSTKATIGGKE